MDAQPSAHRSQPIQLGLGVYLLALLAAPADARLLLSQKQALALAFPGASDVERKTAYLSTEQVKAAEKLGKVKVDSAVWTYYVGRASAAVSGYAYFETHVVRTQTETFMAVLEPGGEVRFVEILAFSEPDDYLASPRWLKQFAGKGSKDDLLVRRGLRNITGASLTAEALAEGVRRILAVHKVLHP